MNQLEQIKQDLMQNWHFHLHTEESGYDEDHEVFEEYLSQIITKAYQAGQEAERERLVTGIKDIVLKNLYTKKGLETKIKGIEQKIDNTYQKVQRLK